MVKVLIVDDAVFMRVAIRTMLEKNDFEVIAEAADGSEAVDKYKVYRPDVVTMDITMAGMNGIDAIKLIREFDPQARVVVVSAMGHELMVKEAVICGARSFIVKPIKEDHMVETLKKIAAMH